MDRPLNLDLGVFEPETYASDGFKPKKRNSDPKSWMRNKAKKARCSGSELKNTMGEIIVRPKVMRLVDCVCGCSDMISEADKEFIFETFYSKASHELQNEYLRGCTEVADVQNLSNGKQRRVFLQKLHFQNCTIRVCQKFFLAIHGISRSRLRKKVLMREVDIEDRRGKHSGHYMRTSYETRDLMRIFFKSLPARHSHYSVNKNPNRLYMESHWTITSLYERFFVYFPDVTKENATLTIFRKIFNTEFNIKFGFPRTDRCDTCSKFLTRISNVKNQTQYDGEGIDELHNQHDRHLEFADIFYRDMAAAKHFVESHFALCMDFQQNMPIPVTRVNKEFYLRQMWIYNFGIKNVKTGRTTMFLYSENFANKGANEVISCLLWYISERVPTHVTTLSIFCDNPAGQNKNRFVYAALQNLSNTRFERIYVKYPVPGHSRMPIDADFGLIEAKKRRVEQIFIPSQVVTLVKSARTETPFDVVFVNVPLTDDLCPDENPVVTVLDYKTAIGTLFKGRSVGGLDLNSIRELRFVGGSKPLANFSERFTIPPQEINVFSDRVDDRALEERIASAHPMYEDFLPIKLAKVKNLEILISHTILAPEAIFYDVVYAFDEEGYRRYVRARI